MRTAVRVANATENIQFVTESEWSAIIVVVAGDKLARHVSLVAPTSSGDLISRDQFIEFSLPCWWAL